MEISNHKGWGDQSHPFEHLVPETIPDTEGLSRRAKGPPVSSSFLSQEAGCFPQVCDGGEGSLLRTTEDFSIQHFISELDGIMAV